MSSANGNPAHNKALSTLERILVAANHRFATQGYAGARLTDITADANLTTGALYRYLPGKDGLPPALVERMQSGIVSALGEAASRREAIATLIEELHRHDGALRLLFETSTWSAGEPVIDPRVAVASALERHLEFDLSARKNRDVASFVVNLVFHHVAAIRNGGLEPRAASEIAMTIDQMLSSGVYLDGAPDLPQVPPHKDEIRHRPFVQWQPSPDKVMPRSSKGIRTRQTIQDAAVRVFQSKGLTESSISDIAAEAGVASGSVYRYFVDKADILHSMQAEVEEAIIRESHLPLDGGRLAVWEQMMAYLTCYERNLGPIRAWLELAEPGTEMAKAWDGMRSQFIRRAARALERGRDLGLTRTDIDIALVAQLHSMAYESAAYSRYIRSDSDSSPRQLADTIFRLFVGGFDKH